MRMLLLALISTWLARLQLVLRLRCPEGWRSTSTVTSWIQSVQSVAAVVFRPGVNSGPMLVLAVCRG